MILSIVLVVFTTMTLFVLFWIFEALKYNSRKESVIKALVFAAIIFAISYYLLYFSTINVVIPGIIIVVTWSLLWFFPAYREAGKRIPRIIR